MSLSLIASIVLWTAHIRSSSQNPDDESCLLSLKKSLSDPTKSLRNWTRATFASPCNGFTSYLEGATCNNGRIYKLTLAGLSLSGTVPPSLANCSNLQFLDLSSNDISGEIPPDLQSLINLAVINLSSNRLAGQIPSELAYCTYLNVIDLHSNLLTGWIPPQLGVLPRLSVFDVSSNRLSGRIPLPLANKSDGTPRFNASSFEGNKGLFGFPLPGSRDSRLSVMAIVGIGIGSGFFSLSLSFAAVCIWLRITEMRMAREEDKVSQLMPNY